MILDLPKDLLIETLGFLNYGDVLILSSVNNYLSINIPKLINTEKIKIRDMEDGNRVINTFFLGFFKTFFSVYKSSFDMYDVDLNLSQMFDFLLEDYDIEILQNIVNTWRTKSEMPLRLNTDLTYKKRHVKLSKKILRKYYENTFQYKVLKYSVHRNLK